MEQDVFESIFLTLDAPRLANCHTNILKLVITKFLRLVFVHSYFTAAFYIINIMDLPALYLASISQIYAKCLFCTCTKFLHLLTLR